MTRDAEFDSEDGHPRMTEIHDSWNATSEQVTEKNQPPLIRVADQGIAGGILQIQDQGQGQNT